MSTARTTPPIPTPRPGARRRRVAAGGGAGAQRRPGHDRPRRRSTGRRGPRPEVLEGQRLRHRHRRRAQGRPRRRVRRQHRPPDLQDGVHPPGADVPGDRRDRLHRRQPRHAEGDLRRPQLRRPGLRRDPVSYPDAGEALVPAYRAATGRAPRSCTWSSGKVGEPGTDYLTYSGSDICALGHAWGEQFNKSLPDGGDIAIITGRSRQPDRPGARGVPERDARPNIEIVAKQGTAWSRRPTSRRRRRSSPSTPTSTASSAATATPSSGRCGLSRPPDPDGRARHDAPVRRQPVPVRVEGRGRGDGLVHLRRPAPRGPGRR